MRSQKPAAAHKKARPEGPGIAHYFDSYKPAQKQVSGALKFCVCKGAEAPAFVLGDPQCQTFQITTTDVPDS